MSPASKRHVILSIAKNPAVANDVKRWAHMARFRLANAYEE